MKIQEHYPLSDLTTLHIGGPAKYYAEAASLSDLLAALDFAKKQILPALVLGNGSNVLVSDEGFSGLVIHNAIKGLAVEDSGLVSVGAGGNLDDVVNAAVQKNLAGIECLSGVPGSSGGAVVQNIGAYGQTLGDLVSEVEAIEIATGKPKIFSAAGCEFAYRSSWFKINPNKFVITGFRLQLTPGGEPNISYQHVQKHFEGKPNPTLSQVRELVIRIRGSKGYLIMPGIKSYNTAGSFFKNPFVNTEQFEPLKPILGDLSLNRFWETPHGVKIAAAYLMQEAGFIKGYREGAVGISPKHSLSLVNFGGATAVDVKSLADKIKETVYKKFGVRLEEEILYV